jgi:hypothetical protein
MQWEYLTRDWRFVGPDRDEWPGRERYAAGLAQQEKERGASSHLFGSLGFGPNDRLVGEEGDRLGADYVDWRESAERDYLNEIGAAGFELVSVSREVARESRGPGMYFYAFPIIRCHAYFKRTAVPGAPEAPTRRIGFQAPAGA